MSDRKEAERLFVYSLGFLPLALILDLLFPTWIGSAVVAYVAIVFGVVYAVITFIGLVLDTIR